MMSSIEHHLLPPPYDRFERVPASQSIGSRFRLRRGTLIALRPSPRTNGADLLDETNRIRLEAPAATIILWLDKLDERAEIELAAVAGKEGIRGFVTSAAPDVDVLRRELTETAGLATDLIRYLRARGWVLPPSVRDLVHGVLEHAAECRAVRRLADFVDSSPRWTREMKACGLGTPRPFFQVVRCMVIAIDMQREWTTRLEDIAWRYGFHDASALHHRVVEVFGCSPTDVRRWLGWEWLLATGVTRAGLTRMR